MIARIVFGSGKHRSVVDFPIEEKERERATMDLKQLLLNMGILKIRKKND